VIEAFSVPSPCCLSSSLTGFAQQNFEFGEDLLNGVEVGTVECRKNSRVPASRLALPIVGHFWRRRLSMMTITPDLNVSTKTFCAQARKFTVFQCPCRTLAFRGIPFRHQSRVRVMLVFGPSLIYEDDAALVQSF